uniref:Chromosome 17 open reading frame 64 n=1 Tax=Anser cygnoides TaxID=8845 RepID=A0A8B9E9W5_ANSCY
MLLSLRIGFALSNVFRRGCRIGTNGRLTCSFGNSQTAEGDAAGTRGEAAPGTGSSHTAQCRTPLVSYVAGLDQDTFKICKEFLRPFKKSLRKLHLPQHLPKKKKVKYTKESLTIIGDRINMFLQQHCKASEVKHWKTVMWRFVSLFSEKDERQLQKLYKYIKGNRMDKFKLLARRAQILRALPVPPTKWALSRRSGRCQQREAELMAPAPQLMILGAVH